MVRTHHSGWQQGASHGVNVACILLKQYNGCAG